ncbi:hypothetical protein I317_02231 [Kwoniella heveanensis CBS 569]|nr:hypothetical protein I317_02231 [Kwoniella heveanensis CBS 569]
MSHSISHSRQQESRHDRGGTSQSTEAHRTAASILQKTFASTGGNGSTDGTASTIRGHFDTANDEVKSSILNILSVTAKTGRTDQGSSRFVGETARQVVRGINGTRNRLMEGWNRQRQNAQAVQSSLAAGEVADVHTFDEISGGAVGGGEATEQPMVSREGHWAAPESTVAQTLDGVMKERWFTEL